MLQSRRFTIRGHVQGVWFRESTRRQAVALSLTGSAVNLDNGEVEVRAYGEPAALDELFRWLQHGPPLAEVAEVVAEVAEWQAVPDFTTA